MVDNNTYWDKYKRILLRIVKIRQMMRRKMLTKNRIHVNN